MSASRDLSSLPPDELVRRCVQAEERRKRAESRILELERLLMKYVAQDRSSAVRRELLQGQPLLDLAAGLTPPAPSEASDGGEDEDGSGEDDEEPPSGRSSRRKSRGGRRKLPAHLPREVQDYTLDPMRDLPDYDPAHGYQVIDHDTCEELVLPRPEPKVIVHRRPVVLYTTLDGETRLATVGGISKVFPKCAASPSVLARIAVDRLHNHLTLYRIERSFAELGCPLARSTLCQWMVWLGELLRPLARAQEETIRAGPVRFADDTVVRVLAPGVCDTVRVWVLLGDGQSGREIVFKHTPSRTADAAREILGAHTGYVQVDACGVYDGLFADGVRIEVGCWSHVFRKFEEVALVDARARPMLRLIGKLYAVEDAADEAKLTPKARWVLRLLASRPLLARIGAWVARQRDAEPLESSFKKALNYVVNQWSALKRFLEDGRLRLDNNLSEAEFHVVGVGRRNWLFFGSREGLKSALVLYGLIRSCVAHGIDPYVYLVDVIRRVAGTDTPARELIPSRWKQLPPLPIDKPDRSPAQLAGTG
ncbi:MAG: IS66 family transposase [Planctomycetes bacterium]|nr:IS66 family transposase [Planctomycetota bacterium]